MDHPYGTPGGQQQNPYADPDIVNNADGTQSIRRADGSLEPYNGDRSLTGNIGVCSSSDIWGKSDTDV